jgi:hypothetical protein
MKRYIVNYRIFPSAGQTRHLRDDCIEPGRFPRVRLGLWGTHSSAPPPADAEHPGAGFRVGDVSAPESEFLRLLAAVLPAKQLAFALDTPAIA